jgi:hypothetical protein
VKLLERQKSGYKQKPLGQWPWLKLTIQDLWLKLKNQCSCFQFSDCRSSICLHGRRVGAQKGTVVVNTDSFYASLISLSEGDWW